MGKIQNFKDLKSRVTKKRQAQEIANKKIEALIKWEAEDLARDSRALIEILSNGSDEIKRLGQLICDISCHNEITERLIERAKDEGRCFQ